MPTRSAQSLHASSSGAIPKAALVPPTEVGASSAYRLQAKYGPQAGQMVATQPYPYEPAFAPFGKPVPGAGSPESLSALGRPPWNPAMWNPNHGIRTRQGEQLMAPPIDPLIERAHATISIINSELKHELRRTEMERLRDQKKLLEDLALSRSQVDEAHNREGAMRQELLATKRELDEVKAVLAQIEENKRHELLLVQEQHRLQVAQAEEQIRIEVTRGAQRELEAAAGRHAAELQLERDELRTKHQLERAELKLQLAQAHAANAALEESAVTRSQKHEPRSLLPSAISSDAPTAQHAVAATRASPREEQQAAAQRAAAVAQQAAAVAQQAAQQAASPRLPMPTMPTMPAKPQQMAGGSSSIREQPPPPPLPPPPISQPPAIASVTVAGSAELDSPPAPTMRPSTSGRSEGRPGTSRGPGGRPTSSRGLVAPQAPHPAYQVMAPDTTAASGMASSDAEEYHTMFFDEEDTFPQPDGEDRVSYSSVADMSSDHGADAADDDDDFDEESEAQRAAFVAHERAIAQRDAPIIDEKVVEPAVPVADQRGKDLLFDAPVFDVGGNDFFQLERAAPVAAPFIDKRGVERAAPRVDSPDVEEDDLVIDRRMMNHGHSFTQLLQK